MQKYSGTPIVFTKSMSRGVGVAPFVTTASLYDNESSATTNQR